MFAELLLAATFQVGPFYEQRPADDYLAVRPFYAHEGDVDDVLWPVFTSHRDWWRFCFFLHYQSQDDGGWQFDFIPLWFNGHKPQRGESAAEDYWGLFPIYGHHPHLILMYDIDFALWPVWTRYRMPRWSFWPLYGINHQRESDHQYALWPIVTWANYREDRDTAGEGYSWMVWPLYGQIRRARERQDLVSDQVGAGLIHREHRPVSVAKIGSDGDLAVTACGEALERPDLPIVFERAEDAGNVERPFLFAFRRRGDLHLSELVDDLLFVRRETRQQGSAVLFAHI